MEKIVKENGKVWLVEEIETYGVKHTKMTHIGDYDEIEELVTKEKPKKRKQKKDEE